MGFNSGFKGLSLCRKGFQDLLKVRPSPLFILCRCISRWTWNAPTQYEQRRWPTCLWRWNRQSVPKRQHIKFRRRGITQKKTYNNKQLSEQKPWRWFQKENKSFGGQCNWQC